MEAATETLLKLVSNASGERSGGEVEEQDNYYNKHNTGVKDRLKENDVSNSDPVS